MAHTLRGMTWDHPRGYFPMVATAAAYQRLHPDVQITWEKRTLQAFADAPIEAMAERYDLLVIDHPHMGSVAASKCVIAFDETGRGSELTALAGQSLGPSYGSYVYDDHVWALPIDAASQVAAYRPDLLARPPATWREVVALARAGQVLWPIKPVDSLMSFFTLAANRGTPCATEPDRLIAEADGLEVLAAMSELAAHVPWECLAMNPPGVLDWLSTRDDKAYCPLLYGYSNYGRPLEAQPWDAAGQRWSRPHVVRFANIPALGDAGPRGSTIGGAGLAISRRCRAMEQALDHAFWVASAECQRTVYFESGGQPANAVAWGDQRVNAGSSDFFRDTRETLEHAWVRPRYDGYMAMQDTGGTILNEFLGSGAAQPQAALQRLEQAYRESRKGKRRNV